jgi:hypothetical protein
LFYDYVQDVVIMGSNASKPGGKEQIIFQACNALGINMAPDSGAGANGANGANLIKLQITGGAGKTVGGVKWINISDRRVKKDFRDISKNDIIYALNNLRPVKFRYISEYLKYHPELNADEFHFNYIAQEFEQIFPEYSYQDPITGIKSISIHPTGPYIVAMIQYLHKLVEELEIKKLHKYQRLSELLTKC